MENLSFHYKINLKKKVLKKKNPTPIFSEFKKKIHPVPPTSCREFFFDVPMMHNLIIKNRQAN